MKTWLGYIGLFASCVMPLFNIPMILHILKRRSSRDLSLTWLFGVWACVVLMFPSALLSSDKIFRIFGILNLFLFSSVVIVACRYRKESV